MIQMPRNKKETTGSVRKSCNYYGIYSTPISYNIHRPTPGLPLPIQGTSSLPRLEENMASAKLQPTPAEWKTIESLAERA
jgi:diketogulonate reductase-like aldo/keto reductase